MTQEVAGLNPAMVTNKTSTFQRFGNYWFYHFHTFLKLRLFIQENIYCFRGAFTTLTTRF
jgi:hypothetical protein